MRAQARLVDFSVFIAGGLVWTVAAAIFFRYPIFSSFDHIFGDRADGSMIIYFHEHMFNVLQGRAQFTSPQFFYPEPDVLGFGPAFLLDSVPYSILRLIGYDPFLSFQLLIIILSLASFMASLTICVRYLKIRTSIALCAAVLMTFANNLFVKGVIGHANFLLLYYIPCIVLIALWGIEDFPRVTRWSILRVRNRSCALFPIIFDRCLYGMDVRLYPLDCCMHIGCPMRAKSSGRSAAPFAADNHPHWGRHCLFPNRFRTFCDYLRSGTRRRATAVIL